MEQKCFVSVSIRGLDPGASSRAVVLGESHAVWEAGVSIGSDPNCTVVLPDLAPVAVRIIGASNHKLLYRLPDGTSLPLPPVFSVLGPEERVDGREFQVGLYRICFGEVYRGE